MSTDATSCQGPIPCPVCVVTVLPSEPFVMDWCRHCGSDIYNVPGVMAWFNRDGKYACTSNALKAHVPLFKWSHDSINAYHYVMGRR